MSPPAPANPDSFFRVGDRVVELKVHRLLWSGDHPENSLSALAECARERVIRAEIDLAMLRDRDFALLHDDRLEKRTTGRGQVSAAKAADLGRVRFKGTDERPALLSEFVAVLARAPYPRLVELDMKDQEPLPWARIEELARLVQPVKGRIVFGSPADWNLRRLLAVDRSLPVSLNPHSYIDFGERGGHLRRGAYGYQDAHPLARRRFTSAADYLRDRFGGVLRLVPGIREVHVRSRMFERMLDDLPEAADIFHSFDVKLDVWTLDAGTARWRERFARVVEGGVDIVTTNTAPALAAAGRELA